MANAMYDKGREGFLAGDIDGDDHEFRVLLIDTADYNVDLANDNVLADIPSAARVAVSPGLTGVSVEDGTFDADDTAFTSVSGDASEAMVVYQHADGGGDLAETNARLVAYIDTDGSGSPISVTPNGGDINVTWNPAGIFTL